MLASRLWLLLLGPKRLSRSLVKHILGKHSSFSLCIQIQKLLKDMFVDYVLSQASRPTKEDAEAITIPHICLAAPSDNEDGTIDAYKEVLSQNGRIGEVEIYPTMFHGWMGGRAKLEDADNVKEFERG
jgi:hypothetical protein